MSKEYALRTITCKYCRKEYTKQQPKTRKYCSRECFYKDGQERKTGKVIKCDNCGAETYKRKVNFENHEHHFCSHKCANEFQAKDKIRFVCKTCGKDFWWSKSRLKQSNIKYCSIECRNNDEEWIINSCLKGNLIQSRKKGPNKLELMGSSILRNYHIVYEEQVLINDKILVDILIADQKLIIQWDGEYWHGHPSKLKDGVPDKRQNRRMKYDKSQNLYLTKCGYKILRFWESEVLKEYKGEDDYIRRTIQEVTRTS